MKKLVIVCLLCCHLTLNAMEQGRRMSVGHEEPDYFRTSSIYRQSPRIPRRAIAPAGWSSTVLPVTTATLLLSAAAVSYITFRK